MKADARPVPRPHRDRLDSWKEIAVYLSREVRTAQRWERREGLPVRRHFHGKASSVWALKHEIDTWLKIRSEAMPHVRHSNQSMDWSSPMKLVTRCAGSSCWLWLVVAPRLQRLESDSGVVTIDRKVEGRKTFAGNQNPSAALAQGNL